MRIVLVRVDDRLIHGQVVVGWVRTVGATHIVVADDEAAGNAMQRTLLKMAAPAGTRVSILPVEEAGRELARGAFSGDQVLVLVRGPLQLLGLVEAGVGIDRVNIGSVRSAPGRERVTKEVYATPEELAAWQRLHERGIALEIQWLPDQPRTDFNEVLRGRRA